MICTTAECTRHCRGAACRSRRSAADTNRLPIKWHAPIASVAAVTAQPLAALPPYGCGVPFTGGDRPARCNSTAQGHWCTARHPDVSLRGAKRRGNLMQAVTISPMASPRFGRVLRDCRVGLRPPRNDRRTRTCGPDPAGATLTDG